jgi:hypothetical protein
MVYYRDREAKDITRAAGVDRRIGKVDLAFKKC